MVIPGSFKPILNIKLVNMAPKRQRMHKTNELPQTEASPKGKEPEAKPTDNENKVAWVREKVQTFRKKVQHNEHGTDLSKWLVSEFKGVMNPGYPTADIVVDHAVILGLGDMNDWRSQWQLAMILEVSQAFRSIFEYQEDFKIYAQESEFDAIQHQALLEEGKFISQPHQS